MTDAAPVSDEVLAEQVAYYRARAEEYDRWFLREGRYDRGDAATAAWREELAMVRRLLDGLALDGHDVLELAPGTGLWTAELVARGARVTVVDAAPEMLDQLTRRLGDGAVTTIEADLFDWTPPREFDDCVACFFMSHVPDERFDAFCAQVAAGVRAGGQVFLLDGLREPTSTADDHELPEAGTQTMRRRLDDGRTFEIVKRFRDDDTLLAACARHGLDAIVVRTATYFQVVLARRAAGEPGATS